jgi:hypothetical protein
VPQTRGARCDTSEVSPTAAQAARVASVDLDCEGRTDELGRCTLTKKLDSFSRQDTAGANSVSFDGRVNGKGLPKGTYTLTLVTTMAGISSSKQTLTFTVTT